MSIGRGDIRSFRKKTSRNRAANPLPWNERQKKTGYTEHMGEDQIRQLRAIIKKSPSLLWYTRAYDNLNAEAVAEAIYNYGSWENVVQYHRLLGIKTAREIFRLLRDKPRTNLFPKVRYFFEAYYGRHAS